VGGAEAIHLSGGGPTTAFVDRGRDGLLIDVDGNELIAAGCPIVLKPAPATPLTASLLGELLAETELPAGSWSVLPMRPVESVEEAFARVDASRFGLHAGIFTHDVRLAFRASTELEVGGVIVGDVPSYRADQMPYGGTKDSGTGREGVRAAMDDLTEPRVLVLTGVR
jgi:acyl-CoA reductase-like NAD-dependent aldehyde dehydrogenase